MTRIIEIIVSPEGQTRVVTKGFQGRSCMQASKFIADALGQVVDDRPTTEFYQAKVANERERIRRTP